MLLHERLDNRVVMEVFLKIQSPLHVGAGGVGEITKSILQFTVGGSLKPIIPAESIKGILRAEATRIAKKMSFSDEVNKIVNAHNKAEHHFENTELKEAILQKAIEFVGKLGVFENNQISELSQDSMLEIYASYHCPICRLFGSKYLAGKLLFTDAIPVVVINQKPASMGSEQESQYLKLNTYTSTAINRKTRIVDENKLFRIQFVEPNDNLRFYFKIIADNVLEGYEATLLANVLQYITLKGEGKAIGINFGGAKSRGFGTVEVDEDKSFVKLARFVCSPTKEEKLNNIRRLLFKEGSFEVYSVSDFIKLLGKVS